MSKKAKKIIKIVVISIVTLAITICFGGYMMFHNEIKTLHSIEKLDDYPFYMMEYLSLIHI